MTLTNGFNPESAHFGPGRTAVRTPVSIGEVAAHAGVSAGAVSNILNGPEVAARPASDRVHAAVGFVRDEPAVQAVGQARAGL